MSTIIEVRGRGRQLLERCHCEGETIRIGRAFDNDLIVEDAHISAHHLQLSVTDNGWLVEDLDSLNGVTVKGKRGEVNEVTSGDVLLIGNLALYLYRSDHPVDPPLKIQTAERPLLALGNLWVWPLLMALAIGLSFLESYQKTVIEFKPLTVIQPTMEVIFGGVAIALVWALIGRLLRHRAYFFAHLSIWIIAIYLGQMAEWLVNVASYNLSSASVQEWFGQIVGGLVIVAAVWASLLLATNLRSRVRLGSAVGVAVLIALSTLATQLRFDREFSSQPQYFAMIKRPGLLWVEGRDPEAALEVLDDLFARADEEAAKEP